MSAPAVPLRKSPMQRNADMALNAVFIALAAWGLFHFSKWAVVDADWHGTTRADCRSGGACWAFIANRWGQFMFGFYPADQRWRPEFVGLLAMAGTGWLMAPRLPAKRIAAVTMLTAAPVMAAALLYGGVFGLPVVTTEKWGGLLLTLILGAGGIVLSFPLAVGLALARSGSLPLIRWAAVAYIEVCRGLPLIAVLFMARLLLPLALPPGTQVDVLALALAGIVMFESAFLAEVIRGGLQALPSGQVEASKSLGFGYWRTTVYVTLPQALSMVVPGIVNNAIALVKNTTLVIALGLFEFLNIVSAGAADPDWLGMALEGYVVVGSVFWLLCFGLSRYSQAVERRIAAGGPRPTHGAAQ